MGVDHRSQYQTQPVGCPQFSVLPSKQIEHEKKPSACSQSGFVQILEY